MFASAAVSAVVLRSLVLAVALVAPPILLSGGFEHSLAYALLAGTLFVGALAIDIARCRLTARRSGLANRD